MSILGSWIREARLERGLKLPQIAEAIGYSRRGGAGKGARRIAALERDGLEETELVINLLDALGLDHTTARDLADADERDRRADWEAWADETSRPFLAVRYGPHSGRPYTTPDGLDTDEEATAWAERLLRDEAERLERPLSGRLILSRRLHLILDSDRPSPEPRPQTYKQSTEVPGARFRGQRLALSG